MVISNGTDSLETISRVSWVCSYLLVRDLAWGQPPERDKRWTGRDCFCEFVCPYNQLTLAGTDQSMEIHSIVKSLAVQIFKDAC